MTDNELPARLAARPFDTRRGLPVAYVSEHDDGSVDFSLINGTRVLDCVRRGLCSACGQPHKPQIAFVGGPGGFRQRRYRRADAPRMRPVVPAAMPLSGRRTAPTARSDRADRSTRIHAAGKADPVILAITTGCRVELQHEPGYAPTVQFRPAPWI